MSTAARTVCRSVLIDAPAQDIFQLLIDPRRHPDFDGSGSVRAQVHGPQQLSLGQRFGMRMHLAVPYVITNTVVAFEPDRVLAWRHLGRHIWRYDLEPVAAGTRVTESFCWGSALAPWALELLRVPAKNTTSIERTLPRLKALVESAASATT